MMKAETKAKRRAIISLVGLGMLDEVEVDSVADARKVQVDMATGEILEAVATPQAEVKSAVKHLAFKNALRDAGVAKAYDFNAIFGTEIPDKGIGKHLEEATEEQVAEYTKRLEEYLTKKNAPQEEIEETVEGLLIEPPFVQGGSDLRALVA